MKISKNILSEPNQPSIVSICQHIIITIFDKRILQNESDYFLYIKKKRISVCFKRKDRGEKHK